MLGACFKNFNGFRIIVPVVIEQGQLKESLVGKFRSMGIGNCFFATFTQQILFINRKMIDGVYFFDF